MQPHNPISSLPLPTGPGKSSLAATSSPCLQPTQVSSLSFHNCIGKISRMFSVRNPSTKLAASLGIFSRFIPFFARMNLSLSNKSRRNSLPNHQRNKGSLQILAWLYPRRWRVPIPSRLVPGGSWPVTMDTAVSFSGDKELAQASA